MQKLTEKKKTQAKTITRVLYPKKQYLQHSCQIECWKNSKKKKKKNKIKYFSIQFSSVQTLSFVPLF